LNKILTEKNPKIIIYPLILSGILVPGGFGTRGVEGMIAAANWARLNKKPFLGICLGFQCAVIEFCRNVLNISDASSSEFDKNTPNQVVSVLKSVLNLKIRSLFSTHLSLKRLLRCRSIIKE
jgi:CTP synthase (UTP-ammonia lyase)